jgi:BolA protein
MGAVADAIRERLEAAFAPERLELVDDSNRHAGHSGARAEGESHFTVTVVSKAFTGMGRIERQRKVNTALAPVFEAGLHALSIKALAPEEG